MSTINSYFKARKNRNTPVYISDKTKALQSGTTLIQAQEKIQQQQIEPTKNEQQKESPLIPTKQAKGILRYLSPISKDQEEKNNNEQEEEQEEHIICKIKKPTKLTDIWKDMVENYDRESHTNQLQSDSTDDCATTNSKKKRSQGDDTSRNVRIRMSNQTLLSQSTLPEYYYADDDENEDLSRPIRRRFSLSETNAYLLEIVNELSMDDNSWCQLKPISTVS